MQRSRIFQFHQKLDLKVCRYRARRLSLIDEISRMSSVYQTYLYIVVSNTYKYQNMAILWQNALLKAEKYHTGVQNCFKALVFFLSSKATRLSPLLSTLRMGQAQESLSFSLKLLMESLLVKKNY